MAEKPYHKFSELGDWFACLRKLETWLILGMPDGGDNLDGMRRVFLPSHGFAVCWRFWVEADITLYVDEFKVDDDAKLHCSVPACRLSPSCISTANLPRLLFRT